MKISDAIQYVSLESTAPLYWSVRHSHKSSGFQYPQLINIFGLLYIFGNIYSAQCAVCTVQWPCGILAIAVKTLFHGKTIFLRLFFLYSFRKKTWKVVSLSISGTRNSIFWTLKIGQNDPEIPNLEFENLGVLENQVFLPTEQAGTNICWMIYQDINFKICLM